MSADTAASSTVAAAAASASPLRIYFAASIRGEVVSKPFLRSLIDHMQQHHGAVLTEHIGRDVCESIYERDVAWLRSSDVVVAECSSASLGVGYELRLAEQLRKPILILYRPGLDGKRLSAMLTGNVQYERQQVQQYSSDEEARQKIDAWMVQWQEQRPDTLH